MLSERRLAIQNHSLCLKWVNDFKRHHIKEDRNWPVANKCIKRSSISLVIRKIQIKITMKYHYPPTYTAKTF